MSPSTPDAVSLLAYGFSSTFDPVFNMPLPLNLGLIGFANCTLYSSTEFSIAVVLDNNGFAPHTFNVPELVKWCEREITFQAFALSMNNDLLNSNGLTATIGS